MHEGTTTQDRTRSALAAALVGAGLMAAVDEIVFHQVLAWHHFYDRGTPDAALLSDGLLHTAELVALVAGAFLLADLVRRRALVAAAAWSGGLLGAGGFQLLDGLVVHKVLRLHQVRYDVDLLPYDLAWNGFAVLLLVAGVVVAWRAGLVGGGRAGAVAEGRAAPGRRVAAGRGADRGSGRETERGAERGAGRGRRRAGRAAEDRGTGTADGTAVDDGTGSSGGVAPADNAPGSDGSTDGDGPARAWPPPDVVRPGPALDQVPEPRWPTSAAEAADGTAPHHATGRRRATRPVTGATPAVDPGAPAGGDPGTGPQPGAAQGRRRRRRDDPPSGRRAAPR